MNILHVHTILYEADRPINELNNFFVDKINVYDSPDNKVLISSKPHLPFILFQSICATIHTLLYLNVQNFF